MHGDSAWVWKKDSDERNYHQKKALNRQNGETLANKKLTKESPEEVNELSKKTLGSYVKKAGEDIGYRSIDYHTANNKKNVSGTHNEFLLNKKVANKSLNKWINREQGIRRAADRLTKEEVDEADIGKPGKNFDKIANSAGKEYGSKEAGERVAGAILSKLRAKHPKEYSAKKAKA